MTQTNSQVLECIDELTRRSQAPIRTYEPGDTNAWNQKAFHTSRARYRLLFGGNRSGKSFANAAEVSYWATGEHPYRPVNSVPNEIWIISVEYTTLVKGVYKHLLNLIPDWQMKTLGPNVPGHRLPSFIELKNGSLIVFKSAKGGDARQKFQAAAVDLIVIDEEIDETAIEELEMRTLDTGGSFTVSATLVESYDWILEWQDRAESDDPDYFITRLETEINPHLHHATVQKVKAKLSLEEQEVRLKGLARRSVGLIYDFKDKHIVEDFPIPYDWPRWVGLDPGIRTFGILWITVGPEGEAYIYREAYLQNMPLYEVAMLVKELEGYKLDKALTEQFDHFVWEETERAEHIVTRIIDDKRGSRLITGDEGVLDQLYNRYGIACIPADKTKRPGIEDVRYWLEHGLRVFRSCEKFIWEIKRYRVRTNRVKKDSNEPIDEPMKKDDHLMDCIRYLAREQPKWNDRLSLPVTIHPTLGGKDSIARQIKKRKERAREHEFLGSQF